MSYFLSDVRRSKLIADLVSLTMPAAQAEMWATFADDINTVHYQMLGLAERREEEPAFVQATVTILGAYRAEAADRGYGDVPSWKLGTLQ